MPRSVLPLLFVLSLLVAVAHGGDDPIQKAGVVSIRGSSLYDDILDVTVVAEPLSDGRRSGEQKWGGQTILTGETGVVEMAVAGGHLRVEVRSGPPTRYTLEFTADEERDPDAPEPTVGEARISWGWCARIKGTMSGETTAELPLPPSGSRSGRTA